MKQGFFSQKKNPSSLVYTEYSCRDYKRFITCGNSRSFGEQSRRLPVFYQQLQIYQNQPFVIYINIYLKMNHF